MSIIKGLFMGLGNQKVIPFNKMTAELHSQISSGLAKLMMVAKASKAKLTKKQQDYIINQAKQVQEYEDRYITGIKDKSGNIIKKGKETTADLFDLKGQRMDPNKPIMGGQQTGMFDNIFNKMSKEMGNQPKIVRDESIKKNIAEATKKGDFTAIKNQVLRDPDIAREFALSKKFPFRRDINVRSGEEAIPLARAAKFDDEMKKLNISATPGKDATGTVGEFVNQMKKFNVSDKDIQMMLGSGRSSQVPYVMEQYGLSASDVVNLLKKGKPLIEGMYQGGRVGLAAGSVPKIFQLLKNPKKVKQAIDNIFPTGDVKYDATMAAESLVELNPKIFGNKLYDDLDSITRLDIYDAVISPMMSAQAKALRMKKATKPEKTLQSMKEGKGINMSDPEIAKEFEQFMKQTDPEGVKKLEQTLELDNFNLKGRKKNADGGRAGFKDGLSAKINKPFKIDRGTLRSMFFNKNNPIITGFNTSELFDLIANLSSLPGLADGGRIGYKDGPDQPGRRKFIKMAGGILGAIPFVGTKLLSKATPAISKAAELTGPALDKIVETVMSVGKFVSLKGKRVKEMVTKKKHEGVEVTEDVADQSYIIKKGDKEIYYKPGRQDETGGFEDDIIEVIEDRVKKAGGGIGYMLGE